MKVKIDIETKFNIGDLVAVKAQEASRRLTSSNWLNDRTVVGQVMFLELGIDGNSEAAGRCVVGYVCRLSANNGVDDHFTKLYEGELELFTAETKEGGK